MARWTKQVIPTRIKTGQVTVSTPGTRVALGEATDIISIVVKAKSTNVGNIYIGGSDVTSSNGFILEPGDAISFDITGLASIYIDADNAGDGVSYFAVL